MSSATSRTSPRSIRARSLGQPGRVHRLAQAVAQRLCDERVVGRLDRAPRSALSWQATCSGNTAASRSSARMRAMGRASASPEEPRDRERAGGVPAPADGEHRSLERRLREHLVHRRAGQELEDGLEREGVLRAEREEHAVVGGGGLQLEVEAAAEALAQGEAEGPVLAGAERGVQDELHPARLVEEPLGDERLLGGHGPEDGARRRGGSRPPGARLRAARRRSPPSHARRRGGIVEPRLEVVAQPRHLGRELALRPGASPIQNGMPGAAPSASSTRTTPASMRRMRQEVLPSRKTSPAMLSTAKSSSTCPTATPSGSATTWYWAVSGMAPPPVSAAMRAPRRPCTRGSRRRGGGARWCGPRDVAIPSESISTTASNSGRGSSRYGPGAPHEREEASRSIGRGGGLGHDLLGEHVERPERDAIALERSATEPAHERGALDELVPAHREEPSPRDAALHVRRAADALQRDVERARRAELDDEVHVADVDAELERGGGDDGAQPPRLEPLLRVEPARAGQRSVVGRHLRRRRAARRGRGWRARRAGACSRRRAWRGAPAPARRRGRRSRARGRSRRPTRARPSGSRCPGRTCAGARTRRSRTAAARRAPPARSRRGSGPSPRSGSPSRRARCAAAGAARAPRAARARARGARRACRAPPRGSRRRSPSRRSGAPRARAPR